MLYKAHKITNRLITSFMTQQPDWSASAVEYEKHFSVTTGLFAHDALVLSAISPDTSPKLLDVACGTGALSIPAARRGFQVFATDLSPGMINILNAKAIQEGLSIETKVMDGQSLPDITDDSFDAVSSIFGIFLFPNRAQGWKSAHRVLKPGGIFIAAVWDESAPMITTIKAIAKASGQDPSTFVDNPIINNVSLKKENMIKELTDAGFKDIKVEVTRHEFVYSAGRVPMKFMLENPVLKEICPKVQGGLPAAQRILLEQLSGEKCETDMIEDSALVKEPLHYTATANIFVCRK